MAVAGSAVVGPLLLFYGWLLLWFHPEITNPGWCVQESADWGFDNGTFVWLVTCAHTVAGIVCFGLALLNLYRGRRWWLWLILAAVFLGAAWPWATGLSRAAWCPPF
ncbi:hypothetical protein [Micromonospora thermarum]|uniref:hypothetical protein n=1 Tax=Micromonospora thermarum TaxID=2720024 RepID=UPI001F0F144D|nr:hypothetical protein [Micromonospora thermarum]